MAQLNADPRVMEFFPSTLTCQKSDELVDRIEAQLLEHGFGFWAVEIPGVASCAGFIGLTIHAFETLDLQELVSFTTPDNLPSRNVMEKLGMTHSPAENLDHPMRNLVLYRKSADK